MMTTTKTIKLTVLCCTLLYWFSAGNVHGQSNLKNINQNLRYSRYSRISPKIIPIKTGERDFLLQMPVEKIEENPNFDDYAFSYVVVKDFNEEINEKNIVPLTKSDLKKDTDRHFYFEKAISVPNDQKEAYAVIICKDTRQGDQYIYHTDLISPFITDLPSFGAYYANDIPFDQTYINKGEALLFKSDKSMNLYNYFYPRDFEIPLPPMETRPAPVAKDIEVINNGEFLVNVPQPFDEQGYYFVQTDTTKQTGFMVKTTSDAYPRVSTYDEMIDKLVYISTRNEHEALRAAEDKKKALDKYWLELTHDTEKAQGIIREYFRQIEFANILFTDFKEGWKTDRGMIYTVMGPPVSVFFDVDKEIWIYDKIGSKSKISFTFARIRNIFTPNYYKLNRSRSYQPEWFQSITLWRSGKMAF
ncbi:GWxTD domain-containing protein [Echinicola strongylocentroti]|uniref:GWxTD domain-containing protein n=1 Tax=Echinicola strongylocentroti TaxID=1795355 RepID=A0A2Z4ILL1_9BACT|nr:GWxTD domain-containing protein [Echinicola strongylocentroti]AWW31610.1 GWxTD domain-containing protein [Echinicola strongylocentroti]